MPGGRPPKYNSKKHPTAAYKLSLLGLTNEEMAEVFCIELSTFYKWKIDHKEFSDALSGGGVLADADVAVSLRQRALGYSHTEEKVFCFQGEIITHETTKYYPPDTGAIALWLGNRQRKKWSNADQSEQQKPVPINVTIGVRDASRKESKDA